MLLPLFEELRLFLSPEQASCLHLKRGWKPQPLARFHAEHTQAMLGQLAQRYRASGLPVRVYLSSHYVRSLLLPWQPGLSGESEWQAYARHVFDEAFGTRSRIIRLARQGYGQPLVAHALDEGVQQEITTALAASGLKLKSMEPYCGATVNQYRKRLPLEGWLFTAEPGMATSMRFDHGHMAALTVLPLEADFTESLLNVMGREFAKCPTQRSDMPVFLHTTSPTALRLEAFAVTLLAAGRDDALGVAT